MFVVLTVLAIVGVVVIGFIAVGTRRRPSADDRPQDQDVAADAGRSHLPGPGAPSPHDADGEPIPGSRDDRHRHGQP